MTKSTSRKSFYVFSNAKWVAEDLIAGVDHTQWDITHSYGLDVPLSLQKAYTAGNNVAYWMPAAFAARLLRTEYPPTLTAPPKNLLSILPKEITGRTVKTLTLKNFRNNEIAGEFFLKPAEAKLEYFPAQQTSWDKLDWLLNPENPPLFPDDMIVQYTTSILNINHEYRFYVLNGEPVTGSAYLVDDETFYDNETNPRFQERFEEAEKFAHKTLQYMPPMPEGYVLDVAYDESSSSWIVLEANPAWCSAFYGSDIPLVMATVEASCNPDTVEHIWTPDAALSSKAKRQPILPYQI